MLEETRKALELSGENEPYVLVPQCIMKRLILFQMN